MSYFILVCRFKFPTCQLVFGCCKLSHMISLKERTCKAEKSHEIKTMYIFLLKMYCFEGTSLCGSWDWPAWLNKPWKKYRQKGVMKTSFCNLLREGITFFLTCFIYIERCRLIIFWNQNVTQKYWLSLFSQRSKLQPSKVLCTKHVMTYSDVLFSTL